jgi:hypothetical protein
VIFVGRPSSTIGVETRRVGVASGKDFRLLYLVAAVFGVDFAGVDFLGVDAGLVVVETGDDASLLVADSRRSRAGRTRFCGIEDCDALTWRKGS